MRKSVRENFVSRCLAVGSLVAISLLPSAAWAGWRDDVQSSSNWCTGIGGSLEVIAIPNYNPSYDCYQGGGSIVGAVNVGLCGTCPGGSYGGGRFWITWATVADLILENNDDARCNSGGCGENSCKKSGSIIGIDGRTVGESVPLVGTPWTLNHFSDRTLGRLADYTLRLPIADSAHTPPVYYLQMDFTVAGRNYSYSSNDSAGPPSFLGSSWEYVWDGLDSSSNPVQGTVEAAITRSEKYTSSSSLVGFTTKALLGGFQAKLVGLGGWTISVHHYYDFKRSLVYLGNGDSQGVRTLSGSSSGAIHVLSRDESEVFKFDSSTGVHLATLDSKTGTAKLTFAYDGQGRLSTITDAFSNVTTVQRNGSGVLTGIEAPYGQVTSFTLNSNGYLATITNPNSEVWTMTYVDAKGLFYTFEKPGGQVSTFTYDSKGLLTNDSSSAGSSLSLSQSRSDAYNYSVTATTEEGRATTYAFNQPYGNISSRSITSPQGVSSTSNLKPAILYPNDYDILETAPDYASGSAILPHPQFEYSGFTGDFMNYRATVTSQSSYVAQDGPTYTGLTAPFTYTSYDHTFIINGKTHHDVYTKSSGQTVSTSDEGRVTKWTTNSVGQLTQTQHASYDAVDYSYDSHGRLDEITQNTRSTSLSYNSDGYVSSFTNPASQTTSLTYDDAGRVLTQTLPDSRVITFTYDDNGNLASLTPPNSNTFNFTNNDFDLISVDYPPALSGPTSTNTTYTYNDDKQLTQIDRPDGNSIEMHYHSTGGQLTQIELPSGQGTIDYTYSSGKVASVESPDGLKNEFAYNGYQRKQDVLTLVSSSTTLSTLALGHNNNFDLASSALTPYSGSTSTISFGYDDDFLLTSAGSETITRSSSTGFITGTSLSNIDDSRSYDSHYGELSAYSATYTVTPTTLFSQSFTRDSLGRILTKSETVNGTTHTYAYTYDSAGRLTDVDRDSANYSDYSYNSNSNRSSGHVAGTSFSATVDAQDRLTAYNDLTFSYNLNGERTSRTNTTLSLTTSYSYDELGRLKGVTLPNSDQITYLVDGLGRRSGRKLNGSVTDYYVYEDQLRIGAVLTSAGAISQRFVYGSKPNVPDYMVSGSTTYRMISDERGSVRLVVNASSGAISQQLEYDEFGNVLSDSSPGFQPFGFAGCLYDSDTKLCHFGAREYDADIGRWLTKDPIGFDGGDTNLYGYVVQDPVNSVDPLGLFDFPTWAVDGSAGFGGAISFGLTNLFNEWSGASSQVNSNSSAYNAGYVAGLGLSVARLGYAALAKVGSTLAPTAAGASGFRNILKWHFRGGLSNQGISSYGQMYGSNAALRAAAGRTNPWFNTWAGLNAVGAGAACTP